MSHYTFANDAGVFAFPLAFPSKEAEKCVTSFIYNNVYIAQTSLFLLLTTPDLCTIKVKMCTFQYVFKPKCCIIAQNVFTLHREIKREYNFN